MTRPDDFDFDEAKERREARCDQAIVVFCIAACVVGTIAFALWLLIGGTNP